MLTSILVFLTEYVVLIIVNIIGLTLIDFECDCFQALGYISPRNRIIAAENMKCIRKGSQLLVENLIFLFKQRRKGQGQKFTENTPSVDLANIKLSVMKMQRMLGELTEEKG